MRNLAEEVPGTGPAKQALRLQRTRAILRDLAAGKPVPHLIIQPQLRIAVGANSADAEYIGPDFVVLDPRAGIYVPGEEKSFIVRDNVAAPSDLDTARRQAAAQIIALRGEMQPLGLDGRVMNRAVFIFATPFGLRPSPPFEETLDAEVFEITRALQVLATIRQRLDRLRAASDTPLEQIAGDLQINYQEHCVSSCILATVCKRRCDGQAAQLGEAAGDLLGPATDVRRAIALLDGAPPVTPQEAALAERLINAAAALGQLPARQRRSA